MKIPVNARGQKCPVPLMMAKEALSKAKTGDTLVIEIDNPTSRQNVERFLKDNNASVSVVEKKGVFFLTAVKMEENLAKPDEKAYCSTPPHVVCFNNNLMGTGPEDLGAVLIQAFINTLPKVEPLPSSLLFYNNGIHLAIEGSPILPALHELEKKGVEILVCGTCLDYFKKKDKLKAGRVSNMYEILEKMTSSGHVIEP